jgi:ferredoxin
MIRIIHFRKKCIGCNGCVEADPSRWAMSRKDGKSILIGGQENKGIYQLITEVDDYETALAAAEICPVNIIKVERVKEEARV